MRVRLIIPPPDGHLHANSQLAESLYLLLEENKICEVAEKCVDVTHVIGMWDHKTANIVAQLDGRGIPVVFTSVSGAESLLNKEGHTAKFLTLISAVRSIARHSAYITTGGDVERQIISRICPKAKTVIVRNPFITSSSDVNTMLDLLLQTYRQALEDKTNSQFEAIRKKIAMMVAEDATESAEERDLIIDLCSRVLYIKQQYQKGVIHLSYLDSLSDTLKATSFDEYLFQDIIAKKRSLKFVAHAMALMEETSALTEGFMPVRTRKGKVVEKMKELLTP